MPQINQLLLVYQSQWFWLALVLAVIYFGVGKAMLPKIEATLDDRDRKIAGDLAAAEAARAAAAQTEAEVAAANAALRAEHVAITAAAKAKGAKDAEGRLAKANAEVAKKLAVAEQALGSARAEGLKSIESVAAELAQDIVARVSGIKVSASEAQGAVKAAMANG